MISCSSSTQLITSDFFVILESHIDPGSIPVNINLIPVGEIPIKALPICGSL